MRYGYFLAHERTEHGDPQLAAACRDYWDRTCHVQKPLPFDGVSAWEPDLPYTAIEVRVFSRDFFNDPAKPHRVVVHAFTRDVFRPD